MPETNTQPGEQKVTISQSTLNKFFAITKDIMADLSGKNPGKAEDVKYLRDITDGTSSVSFEQDKETAQEKRIYESYFGKAVSVGGTGRAYDAEDSEIKQFSRPFIKQFSIIARAKKRQLGANLFGSVFYPNDKGEYNSESRRQLVAFAYEVAKGIENDKLEQVVASRNLDVDSRAVAEKRLQSGQYRLFVINGREVALTEEEAGKPENKGAVPYIEFGLRGKAYGKNAETGFTGDKDAVYSSTEQVFDNSTQVRQCFNDSRLDAAISLLTKNRMIVVEPLTMDVQGNMKGKVRASNGSEDRSKWPLISVNAKVDPLKPDELWFDFIFDEDGRKFRLTSSEMSEKLLDEKGEPRNIIEVAKGSKLVKLEEENPPLDTLIAPVPATTSKKVSLEGESKTKAEGIFKLPEGSHIGTGITSGGEHGQNYAGISAGQYRETEKITGTSHGPTNVETNVQAKKQEMANRKRIGTPTPGLASATGDQPEETEESSGGRNGLSTSAKIALGAGGTGLFTGGGIIFGAAGYAAEEADKAKEAIGYVVHHIAAIFLS